MQSFVPPPGPPPHLTYEELCSFAQTGHLPLRLSDRLVALYNELFTLSKEVFELDEGRKKEVFPASQGTESGYFNIQGEKEYITFRCRSSSSTSSDAQAEEKESLQERMDNLIADIWRETSILLLRILHDISRFLHLQQEAWDSLLQGCTTLPNSLEESTPSLLRTFRYEPNSGIADRHTDLGLLTVCVGQGQGLEVLSAGEWSAAPAITLLAGDTLSVLSSARIRPASHRVVANPKGRQSIIFALRASTKCVVDMGLFGGSGEIHSQELFDMIKNRRVNVNDQKGAREKQKEALNSQRQSQLASQSQPRSE